MIAAVTNQNTTQTRRDELLDTLAAELTDAAYPIALRYRDSGSSLDLELEIWRLSLNGSAAGGRSCSPARCRDSRETFAPADAEGVLSESTGGRISRRKAMWIVRLALRRTYTFVVVALLIAVLGGVAINRMSTDIFPEINIPVVSVVWQYTGMPADEIEKRIILHQRARADHLGQRHRAHREPVALRRRRRSASTSIPGPRSRRPSPR